MAVSKSSTGARTSSSDQVGSFYQLLRHFYSHCPHSLPQASAYTHTHTNMHVDGTLKHSHHIHSAFSTYTADIYTHEFTTYVLQCMKYILNTYTILLHDVLASPVAVLKSLNKAT